MNRISHKASAALFCAIGLSTVAVGQPFNIDLDLFFGPPELGNGAPSSSFGGAALQPGFWNRVGDLVGRPIELRGTDGFKTAAALLRTADSPGGTGGFSFQGNTGDFALLLNDAEQVAALIDGGNITYTFSGLDAGVYEIYTYATHRAGLASNTPVYVAEAVHSNVQFVTGPMPGNAFEYLITHSIHRVNLAPGGAFNVSITQPPNHPQGMTVNGFQIVAVPEPRSALAIVFGAAILLLRRSNLSRAEKENK